MADISQRIAPTIIMLDHPHNTDFPAELLIWLSPAFPIGAFTFSQGLEYAVGRNWVEDAASLQNWLCNLAKCGALRNDLIFLSLVRRASNTTEIDDLNSLAAAMQPSKERADETCLQGQAFLEAYNAAWSQADPVVVTAPTPLPVAVGIATRTHGFDLDTSLIAYATSFTGNLVSAAIRLNIIGQFDGQRILAAILPHLRLAVLNATTADQDDLYSATFTADLASILHETQHVRLFRS